MALARDLPRAADRLESLTGVYFVVLMALILVDTRKRFLYLLAVLAAATLLSDFLPFLIPPPDYYSSRTLIWDVGVLRYEGYRLEANFFAFYQTFIIPVLMFFFARYAKPRIARPLILAAIAGSVFVLMLSFSRGGFVSLVVIIVSLLVIERGNRTVAVAGLAALALLTIVAPALYWDRIVSLFEAAEHISEDYAILVRVRTMKVAVILGTRNPLFGVGINNFIGQAARYVPYAKDVHNAFLQAFAELGVFGLAVLVAIFARNIRILWRMITGRPGGEESKAGMFLMVQQIAVGVNAMFIPSVYDPVFWLTLVLPSIARNIYQRIPEPLNSRGI
jgi:O-antigen ligase